MRFFSPSHDGPPKFDYVTTENKFLHSMYDNGPYEIFK